MSRDVNLRSAMSSNVLAGSDSGSIRVNVEDAEVGLLLRNNTDCRGRPRLSESTGAELFLTDDSSAVSRAFEQLHRRSLTSVPDVKVCWTW